MAKKYDFIISGDVTSGIITATNNCSPDERYIRVSCGLDANYAAPIKGVFYGNNNSNSFIENLEISVQTLEYNSQQ